MGTYEMGKTNLSLYTINKVNNHENLKTSIYSSKLNTFYLKLIHLHYEKNDEILFLLIRKGRGKEMYCHTRVLVFLNCWDLWILPRRTICSVCPMYLSMLLSQHR